MTLLQSYRAIQNEPGQSYTWELFLEKISPHLLLERLRDTSIFARGLPLDCELQDPSIVHIFEAVLCNGVITDSDIAPGDEAEALVNCFRNGWLHCDKLADGKIWYGFSSSLHRWYMEWKLWGTPSEPRVIPSQTTNLLQFVMAVIRRFSPEFFSTRKVGPGSIHRLPEAQYQDELYRCCHLYSKGSLVTLPEYGMGRGRVDFYIPSKRWGIELLRDGNALQDRSNRFLPSGSYEATLSLSDHIIIDCRSNYPVKPHPRRHSLFYCPPSHPLNISSELDLAKLYHVVFSNNFHVADILDNELNSVSGEFVLLPSFQ